MSYSIDEDIRMPPKYGRPPSEERLAMLALEIGQSFLIEEEKKAQLARTLNCRLAPRKFSVRKIGRQGWRVWRLA